MGRYRRPAMIWRMIKLYLRVELTCSKSAYIRQFFFNSVKCWCECRKSYWNFAWFIMSRLELWIELFWTGSQAICTRTFCKMHNSSITLIVLENANIDDARKGSILLADTNETERNRWLYNHELMSVIMYGGAASLFWKCKTPSGHLLAVAGSYEPVQVNSKNQCKERTPTNIKQNIRNLSIPSAFLCTVLSSSVSCAEISVTSELIITILKG